MRKKLSKLKSGQYPVGMTPKPRKGDLREVKCKKIPRGTCPHTLLETCAFGTKLNESYANEQKLEILLIHIAFVTCKEWRLT